MSDERQESILLRCEEADIASLLRSSLAPLIQQAKEDGIELRVETLGRAPRLVVDPEKLAWGIATLVGNALRYVRSGSAASAGGSVVVQIDNDESAPDVAIAVQDDGPGIPQDKLPYLFERRFGAAHAEGLALSLVRDIVAAHGGRIEVESESDEEEHGTSVTIYLPRSR